MAQAEANTTTGIERSFIYIPDTFSGVYALSGIQSSYGNVVAGQNITYALIAVNSAGNQSTVTTWTHGANNRFYSGLVGGLHDLSGSYVYVTATSGFESGGSGFSVTLTFTNGDCIPQ